MTKDKENQRVGLRGSDREIDRQMDRQMGRQMDG